LGEANQVEIVNDKYQAVVIPKSTYVLDGQQYEASVFLSSYSSTSNPDIEVGSQKLNIKDGKGIYTVTASGEGERKWKAVVRVKKTDGSIMECTTDEQSYMVSPPSASVSPDKMNVFYIGLENPVTVTAPGFSKDRVHPSISAGEIKGSNGKYIVTVKTPGIVKVTVAGEIDKGKSTVLGTLEFRAKFIPPAHAQFAGKGGGSMSAAAMKGQNRIYARIEDFVFDVKINVNHFTMFINKPRADPKKLESNSASFTPEMQNEINAIIPGSRVTFDYIQATGPDGVKKSLDAITFAVQ
ncbi:MAG: GldM family protein, partial [Legionellales bacterium]